MLKISSMVSCGALFLTFAASAVAQEALPQAADASVAATEFSAPLAYKPVEPGQDLVGNVTGTNIEMKSFDHSVAGVINGGIVWGFYDEATGISKLIMRKYSQVISAEFKRQADKSVGGVITSTDGSSQRSTSVFLAGVDAAAKTFNLRINEEVVTVSITPESLTNGHFVNPTYSTVLGGKPVSYRVEVEGCLGYSIYMAMVVLGAYSH
jgi:hypothetical protein